MPPSEENHTQCQLSCCPPAAKVLHANVVSNDHSQPEPQPFAQNPEDKHVSQLARRKNALFSCGSFLRASLQHRDTECTKENCPQCQPCECHSTPSHHGNNKVTHVRILLPNPRPRREDNHPGKHARQCRHYGGHANRRRIS